MITRVKLRIAIRGKKKVDFVFGKQRSGWLVLNDPSAYVVDILGTAIKGKVTDELFYDSEDAFYFYVTLPDPFDSSQGPELLNFLFDNGWLFLVEGSKPSTDWRPLAREAFEKQNQV
ncbi:MAG TPA: hypothetical protein PKI61_01425 [bacterium]|nr:hypothetical protein [bacterium]HPT29547.1 hypothetical protein [bacterium]